jgi:cytochrome c biogenesis protein
MVGFFYPTAATLHSGALTSAYPALANPVLTLWVYTGDLGIDDGTARNVYALDVRDDAARRHERHDALQLEPGKTVDLPNGLGTITFEDNTANGGAESVKRYVSLSIHRDVGAPWVLGFAIVALAGLARGAVRPAPPDVGQGDRMRRRAARVRRPRARRGPAIAVAVAELKRARGIPRQ